MIFIHNLSPDAVTLGPITLPWYGLLLSSGIILSYLFLRWMFNKEGYPVSDLESVLIYLYLGLIIGARLGEVIFYDPVYYFKNPIDIVKIWMGGLSSHGAAIGLLISYFVWLKIHRVEFRRYADLLVFGVPITAAFVRTGNFFNSEIVGIPTNGRWGVVFKRLGEDFPRHPAQLYEAILCSVIFIVLLVIYLLYFKKTPSLFYVFLFMLLYFSGRFIIEFWKDIHGLPEGFPLSIGQVLSIFPILIATGYFLIIFPSQKI
ncbi:MAG TPA: prolipoprotein diacylglyceryl transferase [Nitrospiraceae bacterium]|nr:prolipoprotein diacylglyceryl transferase [Nitrospiraceae bacterium]